MRFVSVLVSMALTAACSSQPAPPPAAQSAAPATIPITTKSDEARAHFDKGHMLFENLRPADAVAELDQALKLDPDFVSARMLRGVVTPGPDGVKELEAAVVGAGSLPEAERLYIEGAAAVRRGDFEKAQASVKRLVELAPGDARAFYALGQVQLFGQKYAEAATALRKATELNPSAGGAQNMLGYAALRQGDTAGAIAAFGSTPAFSRRNRTRTTRSARRCSRPAASRTRRRRSRNRSSCRRSSGQPMKASATPGSTLATGRAGARHSRRVRTRPRAGRTRSRWKMRWLQRRPPSASSRRRSAFSTCSKRRRAHSRPTSPWCRCAAASCTSTGAGLARRCATQRRDRQR